MEIVPAPVFSSSNTSYEFDLKLFDEVNSHIRHERSKELLGLMNNDTGRCRRMNLTDDPVLNIVISANKTQLAVKLIESVESTKLWEKNILGDTPLHIAAVKGHITVAKALLHREQQLIEVVNIERETALHKAAMYGQESMFRCLVDEAGMASTMYRKGDGSNILHCAIMGNAPELALQIAKEFPELILCRDEAGLTPLQLIVTIPSFLRSPLVSGRPWNSFLYKLIPVEGFQAKNARADQEDGRSVDRDRDEESYGRTSKSVRSKFRPSPYTTILDLKELIARLQYGVFKILKQHYPLVNLLEKEKERYIAAMKLIEYLAMEKNFDFYGKGYTQEPNPTIFDAMGSHSDLQYTWRDRDTEEKMLKNILNETDQLPSRWMEPMEPPLIIAAELGLDDFVRKLLQVCPQSAIYLDSKGRNVMQVAIQSGHTNVVRVISEMLSENNPVLPSCLPSMLDNKTRNTILHLAAENSPVAQSHHHVLSLALQLCRELHRFELVEKIVPRMLVHSRNRKRKTAHELFTKRHEKTLEICTQQLVRIVGTCAGLVTTVVLTSSFSIPSERDNASDSSALAMVSHTYAIGILNASIALGLFMFLLLRPYTMRNFRQIIQVFSGAWMSFLLALDAFILTVVVNIGQQIYGSKMSTKRSILHILEFVLCLVVCICAATS